MSIEFNLSALRNVADLKEKWLSLEKISKPNFMMSWVWVGTWIFAAQKYYADDFNKNAYLLEGVSEGKVISLAIIVSNLSMRYGFVSSEQLIFHRTSHKELEIICHEYNGLLTAKGYEKSAARSAVKFLLTDKFDLVGFWDEIVLRSAEPEIADSFLVSDLSRELKTTTNSYHVDLKEVRASGRSYLSSLSKNTRYQINRSRRLYDKKGGMRLGFAKDAKEAYRFFKEGSSLHKARWSVNGEKSAFDMLPFMSFHEEIMRAGFEKGEIDVIRLTLGQGASEIYMGMLYNFIHKGQVYFYMSALKYENYSGLKPGMTAHCAAIEHYIEVGMDIYNFMAGDNRYKQSLGQKKEQMLSYYYKRPRLMFFIEDTLKKIKSFF